jgi:hypothetical protein
MERQCNWGYNYKFATKCIGRNKNEYVIPKNGNLYKYVEIFFQNCVPFSYPHYDLKRLIKESLHHLAKTRSVVQKWLRLFEEQGIFFPQVTLEMVVLSNFEVEDDLRFLPKLKQSTETTYLSSIIPSTQNFALGSLYFNCSIVVSRT